MRGHCKILLHDTEKKTYKKIEGDNLVTNAYIDRLNYLIISGSDSSSYLPIAEKILGGVMLFDGALTENVNNIHFPAEAHLVGYNDRGSDTSDTMRGTFNSLESGPTDNGYTLTWDFSTSQCNGTIGAVSLTNKTITDFNSGIRNGFMAGDYSTDYHYRDAIYHDGEYAWNLVQGDAANKVNLTRLPVPCGNIKVSTKSNFDYNYSPTWEQVRTINCDHDWIYSAEYSSTGDYIVGATISTNWVSSGVYSNTFSCNKIHVDDWSYEYTSFVLDGITNSMTYRGWAGDYAYATNSGSTILYRINPANAADVSTISFDPQYTEVNMARAFHNGLISVWLYDSTSTATSYHGRWRWAFVYPDNTIVYGNYYFGGSERYRNHLSLAYSETLYPVRNFNVNAYLGTIFNLPSPVTKTAATTMKVIYTLTDV